MVVELDIFSGRPNPTWTLPAEECAGVEALIAAASPASGRVTLPGLGYRGFIIDGPAGRTRVYRAELMQGDDIDDATPMRRGVVGPSLERRLLASGMPQLGPVVHAIVIAAMVSP
ncbi:MAG TPA: hypothetical protein VK324_14310 [Tepidisphaeraceae bacterium]|nr:hypothetical protein [Tepidisphaeraceae bacterium]